jgi:hypothetical protein
MNPKHHTDSARNGPRLEDGREACGGEPDPCGDLEKSEKGKWHCTATGSEVRWPVSGPVNMDCPKPRRPEGGCMLMMARWMLSVFIRVHPWQKV